MQKNLRLFGEEKEEEKKDVAEMGSMMFMKKFIEQRKVFLWDVVDDTTARDVITRLMYLDAEKPGEPITFFINSPGGMVTAGMAIYDTMKLISSPIHTVCMGLAASMGSILLSGGDKGKRSIFPNGEVMIHQPSIGGMFQGRSVEIEIQAIQIRRTKEVGAKILADNCGKTVDQIMKDFDRDYWMNADEAVKYGIVDKVIDKL